ncbi:MAG: NAD-dependent DNA ligase LigA [Candidatus Omnitrophica bacterium]|nr:NAD-dependent DNA ligase LigA [Candidatus Omnitrophota bacterium]
MDKKKIKEKIEKLKKEIRHHDYLYYGLGEVEVADKEYDLLMKQLKDLEVAYPEYKSDDSPTQRVSGVVLEKFTTVRHKQKMLSLDNTYSQEELRQWDERIRKGLGGSRFEYVAELKIDGVSANLLYENGKLKMAATRGDGQSGEDVTLNIKTIRAIPLLLNGAENFKSFEIRGEVYMEIADFKKLNKERQEQGLSLFANPRNATSGSLKLLDSGIVAGRRLSFFAHSLGASTKEVAKGQWEFLQTIKECGMRINPESKKFSKLEDVLAFYRLWQKKRDKLPYEADGLVIKINSFKQQKDLGTTLKSPRWAVAYKFPAHQATTKVLDINVNVGRTGVITPVAVLRPVECGGVIIRNSTLHNFDEIKRLDVKIGDQVLIERAGDVIPKVIKVIKSLRRGGEKVFKVPKTCPACKGAIVKEKEEDVAYVCTNPSCPAQLERGLEHFASRSTMDIEGMGESVVKQLIDKKIVRSFADIYKLKADDLSKLELFKDRKIDNLLNAISKSKNQPLSRLIFALGIRGVGEKCAITLAEKFKALDNIVAANRETLEGIPEVGPVMTGSIFEFFRKDETKRLIAELKQAGLNMQEEASKRESKISGKRIVFTGTFSGLDRRGAQELARSYGAEVSSSVSSNTDYVVAGQSPGSKFKEAEELSIKIINEKEFLALLGRQKR